MILTSLKLSHFRNYERLHLNLSPGVNVIVGDNASGKTNILEAIYLLASGNSFRAGKIEEMVEWNEEVAHVVGEVSDEDNQIRVTLTRGVVQGKRTHKRGFVLNGVPRRKVDIVGLMPAVLFVPEDMDLISGSSSLRRRFMDEALIQVSTEYARSLDSYEKALRRRNKLLDLIRDGQAQRTTLTFWDMLMVKEGTIITRERERLIAFINQLPALSGKLQLTYDRSAISPERLEHYRMQELAVGYTLVGPHRDDFIVTENSKSKLHSSNTRNIATYGSRGEQRMAVLWLKEAELNFIELEIKQKPLLLLDDILSELDNNHEKRVVELAEKQQTVLSTTENRVIELLNPSTTLIKLPQLDTYDSP